MLQPKPRVSFLIVTLMLFFGLLTLPTALAADPPTGPAAQPSPRPPVSETPTPGAGNGGSSSGPAGAILGNVFDLSTNLPGAGVEVQINDVIVRTDAAGDYSLTGQPAGDYIVSLRLPGDYRPAQPPITVSLASSETVVVDLGYYSQPPPTATTEPSPATLPESGRGPADITWSIILIFGGLGLVALGWLRHKRQAA